MLAWSILPKGETYLQDLLHIHTRDVSADVRTQVVDDFTHGKDFLLLELALRTSAWTKLPLRLLALGHNDESLVRHALVDSLVQYEHLPDALRAHELTHLLLAPGGVLREQIVAFVQGTHSFNELPELRRYRDIAVFVPVIEVSVERIHAVLHKGIRLAPRHGPSFVSVAVRRAEIWQ